MKGQQLNGGKRDEQGLEIRIFQVEGIVWANVLKSKYVWGVGGIERLVWLSGGGKGVILEGEVEVR